MSRLLSIEPHISTMGMCKKNAKNINYQFFFSIERRRNPQNAMKNDVEYIFQNIRM